MNDLVKVVNGMPVVISKVVAEHFGKTHRHVLESIRSELKTAGDFGESNFRLSSYVSEQNKVLPCYEMTRDGFSLLAMSFSGQKAQQWKIKYIQAFNAMEQALKKDSDKLEWKQARIQSKEVRRNVTDTIKEFVDYATSQGSGSASKYYMNITKMEYAALELIQSKEKVPSGFRDTLDLLDLCFLQAAEQVCRAAIKEGMERKFPYKEIYLLAKERVTKYAETVTFARIEKK